MTIRLTPFLLALLLLVSPAIAQDQNTIAQQRMTALKSQLAGGKQAFVSRQMSLDSAQETEFWPVYDAHQRDAEDLAARRRANVAAYASALATGVDDDDAEDLAEEALEIEMEEAKLMDRTFKRLSRSLSPTHALKYVQLEAKLSALHRYETAAALP